MPPKAEKVSHMTPVPVKVQKVRYSYPDLGAETSVYGFVVGEGIIEVFASNPNASGLSTHQAGRIHEGVAADAVAPGHDITLLTDDEWEAAFFNE